MSAQPYNTGIASAGLFVQVRGRKWKLVMSRADMEAGGDTRRAVELELRRHDLTIPGWSLKEHKRRICSKRACSNRSANEPR